MVPQLLDPLGEGTIATGVRFGYQGAQLTLPGWSLVLATLALFGLLFGNLYLLLRLNQLQSEMALLQTSFSAQTLAVQQAVSAGNAASQRYMDFLQKELDSTFRAKRAISHKARASQNSTRSAVVPPPAVPIPRQGVSTQNSDQDLVPLERPAEPAQANKKTVKSLF